MAGQNLHPAGDEGLPARELSFLVSLATGSYWKMALYHEEDRGLPKATGFYFTE